MPQQRHVAHSVRDVLGRIDAECPAFVAHPEANVS